MRKQVLMSALLLAAMPALAADYVQAPRAALAFAGKYQGQLFTGTFPGFRTTLRFDPADLANARLDVGIPMATASHTTTETSCPPVIALTTRPASTGVTTPRTARATDTRTNARIAWRWGRANVMMRRTVSPLILRPLFSCPFMVRHMAMWALCILTLATVSPGQGITRGSPAPWHRGYWSRG